MKIVIRLIADLLIAIFGILAGVLPRFLGCGLIAVGAGMIYLPAGVITAGLLIIWLASAGVWSN